MDDKIFYFTNDTWVIQGLISKESCWFVEDDDYREISLHNEDKHIKLKQLCPGSYKILGVENEPNNARSSRKYSL